MLVYIIKRLLLLPVLLFIFSVVAFILIQAPPGDFVTSYVAELAASGSSMDRLQIEALRNLYGLDQPMWSSISNGSRASCRAISASRSIGASRSPS